MTTYSFNDLCSELKHYKPNGIRKRLMKLGIKRAKGTKYLTFREATFYQILASFECSSNFCPQHPEIGNIGLAVAPIMENVMTDLRDKLLDKRLKKLRSNSKMKLSQDTQMVT